MIPLRPECGVIDTGELRVTLQAGTEMAPGWHIHQELIITVGIGRHEEAAMGHGVVDKLWIDLAGRMNAIKQHTQISKTLPKRMFDDIRRHCVRPWEVKVP